jgi:replicative DNA helicase
MNESLIEFERGVIGNIYVHYEQCQHLKDLLSPLNFLASKDYQQIYRLFLDTNNQNAFLDTVIDNNLYVSLAQSSDGPFSCPWQLDYCVNKVLAAFKARGIRIELEKLIHKTDEELPLLLVNFASGVEDSVSVDLEEQSQRQVAVVLENLGRPDRENRMFTGFSVLDKYTGGFQRGNTSVLGALPSSGKTAFALSVVRHCIEAGKRVVMFSLEMNVGQLWERLLANLADISYTEIVRHMVPAKKMVAAKTILEACAKAGLYFFDACLTVEGMADAIVRLKPDLVIVDFLQYVRVGSQRFNSTADRLEFLVCEFKRLAKLPYCPPCHVMLLSQHNRDEKGREKNKKTSMFSLKGSSAIEQGGDYILILDRPCVVEESEPEEKALLSVVKNKFGRLGKVELYFEGDRQRFRELQEGEHYPPPSIVVEERPFGENFDW